MGETISLETIIHLVFFALFAVLFIFVVIELYQIFFPTTTATDDLKQRIEFVACEPEVKEGKITRSCPRTTQAQNIFVFEAEHDERLIFLNSDQEIKRGKIKDMGDQIESTIRNPLSAPAVCLTTTRSDSSQGATTVTRLSLTEHNCKSLDFTDTDITIKGAGENPAYFWPERTEEWWAYFTSEYGFALNISFEPDGQESGTLTISPAELGGGEE